MKKNKTMVGLAILVAAMLLPMILADNAELKGKLIFASSLEENDAYSLSMGLGEEIHVGQVRTNDLIFANNDDYSGFYYKRESGNIRAFSQDYAFLSPIINGLQYDLKHFDSLKKDLRLEQDELDNVGIEDQGFFILATGWLNDAITIDENEVAAIAMPDDGSIILITVDGELTAIDLPADLSFKSPKDMDDIDTEGQVVKKAGGEAEVSADAEEGCFNHDKDNNEQNTASYVEYIFKIDGKSRSIITPDFCAEEILDDMSKRTMLYEAKCDADNLPTYEEIDCICTNGACESEEQASRFCVDTDPLSYNEDVPDIQQEISSAAQGFANTFGVKGTTVGYYAATGGKEFGLWEDYCSDADNTGLVEYYCTNNEIAMFRTIICPKGCSKGVCPEPPYCYETDGGENYNYKGVLKAVDEDGNFHVETDKCEENHKNLTEFFCDSNDLVKGFASITYDCGAGYACRGGKCVVTQAECQTDADCDDGFECVDNFCVEIIEEPVCTADADCDDGFECVDNFCVEIIEEPVCTVDADCDNGEACLANECIKLKSCSLCLEDNAFNILQWQGATCNSANKYDLQLLRCPGGSYCTEHPDGSGPGCVTEPKSSWGDISRALDRKEGWALQMCIWVDGNSEGCEFVAGLESIGESYVNIEKVIIAEMESVRVSYAQNTREIDWSFTEDDDDKGDTPIPNICESDDDCGEGQRCIIVHDYEEDFDLPGRCVNIPEVEKNTKHIGEPCSNEEECIDSTCSKTKGLCLCKAGGDSDGCAVNEYCMGPNTGCSAKKQGGANCYVGHAACLSGTCQGGVCLCHAAGIGSCGATKYCPGANQACTVRKNELDECTVNYQCLNNDCDNGRCAFSEINLNPGQDPK